MEKVFEKEAQPKGSPELITVAMPCDANYNGDVFGGWLMSKMDLACGVTAHRVAGSRITTVAVDSMTFLRPVNIGATVYFYTSVSRVGRTSVAISIEAWARSLHVGHAVKVTEGIFTFVSIDDDGKPTPIVIKEDS